MATATRPVMAPVCVAQRGDVQRSGKDSAVLAPQLRVEAGHHAGRQRAHAIQIGGHAARRELGLRRRSTPQSFSISATRRAPSPGARKS